MTEDTIRALVPVCLALAGAIIAIVTILYPNENSNTAFTIAAGAISGAAGLSTPYEKK